MKTFARALLSSVLFFSMFIPSAMAAYPSVVDITATGSTDLFIIQTPGDVTQITFNVTYLTGQSGSFYAAPGVVTDPFSAGVTSFPPCLGPATCQYVLSVPLNTGLVTYFPWWTSAPTVVPTQIPSVHPTPTPVGYHGAYAPLNCTRTLDDLSRNGFFRFTLKATAASRCENLEAGTRQNERLTLRFLDSDHKDKIVSNNCKQKANCEIDLSVNASDGHRLDWKNEHAYQPDHYTVVFEVTYIVPPARLFDPETIGSNCVGSQLRQPSTEPHAGFMVETCTVTRDYLI